MDPNSNPVSNIPADSVSSNDAPVAIPVAAQPTIVEYVPAQPQVQQPTPEYNGTYLSYTDLLEVSVRTIVRLNRSIELVEKVQAFNAELLEALGKTNAKLAEITALIEAIRAFVSDPEVNPEKCADILDSLSHFGI